MSAPFTIDAATGLVRFPALALELRPAMGQDEFVAATSSLNRDDVGANDGWQRYSIRALIPGDRKLGIFIIFQNSRLARVSFAWAPKDETWADWSEATEKARLEEYQRVLDFQLDDERAFPWGTVGAILDSKSGGTDIWINYAGQ